VRLRYRAGALGVQAGGASVDALAPLRELGGVQAMLAQQGTPAGVAALVGIVLGQNGAALGGGQGRAVSGWGGLVHTAVLAPYSKRGPRLSHLILAHRAGLTPSGVSLRRL